MTCSVLLEGIRSYTFVVRQDRTDIFLPFVLYGTLVLRIFLLKVVILLTHTYGGAGCVIQAYNIQEVIFTFFFIQALTPVLIDFIRLSYLGLFMIEIMLGTFEEGTDLI